MKKSIALCLALIMSASALCACSSENTESKGVDTTSEVSQVETTVAEESTTKETIARDPAISEDSYVNECGVELYVPDGFDTVIGTTAMNAYFGLYKETENDKIYINFWSELGYETPDDATLADLPEITAENVQYGIGRILHTHVLEGNTEYTVESETTETINNMEFLNLKGTLDIDDGIYELDYTVYYTFDESLYNPKSPLSMILFTKRNNAETKAELDEVAREIITKTKWDSEY